MERKGFGSEGDAYRYTKKVLLGEYRPDNNKADALYCSLTGQSASIDVKEAFMERAKLSGKSWTREFYEEMRRVFFRDKDTDIRFAPGVARIAASEAILFGTDWEEGIKILSLREIVKMISVNHNNEYDRYLNNFSFRRLEMMYGTIVDECWHETKKNIERMKFGPRRYQITELKDFKTANKFYEATQPNGWCHLEHESTLDGYRRNGTVRLYIACLPGYENIKEDDPLYGESMLGIDVGKDGRLIHVNNRWNHAHDSIDKRKGDNKYSAEELSQLMGGPFYKMCRPYSNKYYDTIANRVQRENESVMKKYERGIARSMRIIERGRNATIGKIRQYIDPRNGKKYNTRRIGRTTWMLDPMEYVPDNCTFDMPADHTMSAIVRMRPIWRGSDIVCTNPDDVTSNYISSMPSPEYRNELSDGTILTSTKLPEVIADVCVERKVGGYTYKRGIIDKVIPEGWRLPTMNELMELFGAFGLDIGAYAKNCPKPTLKKVDFDNPNAGYIIAGDGITGGEVLTYNLHTMYDPAQPTLYVERIRSLGFNEGIFIEYFPTSECMVDDGSVDYSKTDIGALHGTDVCHDTIRMQISEAANIAGRAMTEPIRQFSAHTGYITAIGDNSSVTVSTGTLRYTKQNMRIGLGLYVGTEYVTGDYRWKNQERRTTTVGLKMDGTFGIEREKADAFIYCSGYYREMKLGKLLLVKDKLTRKQQ